MSTIVYISTQENIQDRPYIDSPLDITGRDKQKSYEEILPNRSFNLINRKFSIFEKSVDFGSDYFKTYSSCFENLTFYDFYSRSKK